MKENQQKMFHLPREIQEKIYEYDSTFREIFSYLVLEELIPNDMRIIQCYYREERTNKDGFCSFIKESRDDDEENIYYNVKFDDGKIEKCLVLGANELKYKTKEYIRNNIENWSTEFLAKQTNLTINAIEILRDNLDEEEFIINMKRLMKDFEDAIEEAINEDGLEHYIEMLYPEIDENYYDFETDSYILIVF